MKWMRLAVLVTLVVTHLAAETDGGHWYRDSWLLPATGVVVALLLCGVIFVARKIMGFVLVVFSMLICAGMVLAAIFGREIGLYQAIFRLLGVES